MAKYAHDDDYDHPQERVPKYGPPSGRTITGLAIVFAIIAAGVMLLVFT